MTTTRGEAGRLLVVLGNPLYNGFAGLAVDEERELSDWSIIEQLITEDLTMGSPNWTEADSVKAKKLWVQYQQQSDLADRVGQTVGIDPQSGQVWFGESIRDIVSQRDAEGLKSLLFFERVGSETYLNKGRRL